MLSTIQRSRDLSKGVDVRRMKEATGCRLKGKEALGSDLDSIHIPPLPKLDKLLKPH